VGYAAGAYLFGLPDAVWEERHQMQERTEGAEVKTADEAWAARKVERGEGRACNPETEFRRGFEAALATMPHAVAPNSGRKIKVIIGRYGATQ